MIARAPAPASTRPAPDRPEPPRWQRALAEAITDPLELLRTLALDPELLLGGAGGAEEAARLFALRVPRGYVARMRPGDPADPLLRQVLPVGVEAEPAPGFTSDPLGEREANPRPGLLRKYRGRALLVVTGACAVHCRYCFRRHFPYGDNSPGRSGWGGVLDEIAADPSLHEVILSGGDPLTANDERLEALVAGLAEIPHVRRLRIHTRNPVVLPERVDERLLGWLGSWTGAGEGGRRPAPVVVVHANHAREIDDTVAGAFERLRDAGATLLNQSVLLAGVNDSVEALADLSEALYAAGAMPYYLHLLDRVAGAAHFEVPEERGRRLVGEVAARVSGYLVPRLVREVPGAPAKVPLLPELPERS